MVIERKFARQAMQRERLKELPGDSEQHGCKHPTAGQIPRLFSLAERYSLLRSGRSAQVFGRTHGSAASGPSLPSVLEDAFRRWMWGGIHVKSCLLNSEREV